MKKTVFALNAVIRMLAALVYAGVSYDAMIFSDISEWVKSPFWKKFWSIGIKLDRGIAMAARHFC